MGGSGQDGCRLAAIVYEREEDADGPLTAFVGGRQALGARVAGLLQQHGVSQDCLCDDVYLVNIATGEAIPVMQNLGPGAAGCRVDPGAIAGAAQQMRASLATRPDLLVANRFGKLEAAGGGLIEEIGEAVASDIPLIVCVPARFRDAWDAFASGLDVKLPPRRDAIEAWWEGCAPARASAA